MKPAVIQDTPEGVVLTVHVQPKASRTECAGVHGGALKFRVAAPPVDGAANEALIEFLAEQCGIPKSAIEIRAGAAGRHKRVLLKGVAAERVRRIFKL
jgi:hypothetical protein